MCCTMRCGSLVLIVAAAAGLPGQVPEPLDRSLREEIGRRWQVAPERVVLDWGSFRWEGALPPTRLVGTGRGGWFAVVLDDGSARARAVQLRAGVRDTVLAAARALVPGDTIRSGDYEMRPQVHWGAPVPGERPVPGWIVRRSLAPGTTLLPPQVLPPPVISKGEPVRIVWNRGAVEISVAGTAMHAAARGESVRVRLAERSLQIVALAAGPGTATLQR